jgi:hypothetical protein
MANYIRYQPLKTGLLNLTSLPSRKSLPSLNPSSLALTTFRETERVTYQFVVPNQHRTNPAERAIRTAKNHFLAVLSAAHISFPLNRWPALLPLIELTLNHLRSFARDRSISAWHGIQGQPLDFAAHPIYPAGQLVVAHDPHQQRAS